MHTRPSATIMLTAIWLISQVSIMQHIYHTTVSYARDSETMIKLLNSQFLFDIWWLDRGVNTVKCAGSCTPFPEAGVSDLRQTRQQQTNYTEDRPGEECEAVKGVVNSCSGVFILGNITIYFHLKSFLSTGIPLHGRQGPIPYIIVIAGDLVTLGASESASMLLTTLSKNIIFAASEY